MAKDLTQSLETYLLAIDSLLNEKSDIIVKDVAQYLNLGGASTSVAVKKLKEKGYLNYEPYGNIILTTKGKDAVFLKKYRHNTISKFLHNVLEIDTEKAEENANSIEYSMTEDVLAKLVNFMDFMDQCTCAEPKWVNSCKTTLKTGEISQGCKNCTGNCCCNKH